MTTWIIIACVAVYVADEFLPLRYELTGNFIPPDLAQLDRDKWVLGTQLSPQQFFKNAQGSTTVIQWAPVFQKSTGAHIGWVGVRPFHFLESFLYLSTDRMIGKVEYWRLIGFQFLHDHGQRIPWHLLLNMVGLYFFGPLVEDELRSKRYFAFFLVCGIFGAITYVLLNLGGYLATLYFGSGVRIPGLLFSDTTTPLVGASAGIFGIIIAGAFLAPDAKAFYFFIPMRLSTLAYIFVGLAFVAVLTGGQNAGGEASHLGGAAAGWYFIRNSDKLHNFFNVLGRFDPTSRHHRSRRAGSRGPAPAVDSAAVDRILDKVRLSGIESLTQRERDVLRDASRR